MVNILKCVLTPFRIPRVPEHALARARISSLRMRVHNCARLSLLECARARRSPATPHVRTSSRGAAHDAHSPIRAGRLGVDVRARILTRACVHWRLKTSTKKFVCARVCIGVCNRVVHRCSCLINRFTFVSARVDVITRIC